jgi:hypothetical protein
MFQQGWRHLKEGNIESASRMWLRESCKPSHCGVLRQWQRPLASISPLDLVISRGGKYENPLRIHGGRETFMIQERKELVSRQSTTRSFRLHYLGDQAVGSKE